MHTRYDSIVYHMHAAGVWHAMLQYCTIVHHTHALHQLDKKPMDNYPSRSQWYNIMAIACMHGVKPPNSYWDTDSELLLLLNSVCTECS